MELGKARALKHLADVSELAPAVNLFRNHYNCFYMSVRDKLEDLKTQKERCGLLKVMFTSLGALFYTGGVMWGIDHKHLNEGAHRTKDNPKAYDLLQAAATEFYRSIKE